MAERKPICSANQGFHTMEMEPEMNPGAHKDLNDLKISSQSFLRYGE